MAFLNSPTGKKYLAKSARETDLFMSIESKIEWTDMTWNVVTGCQKVSDGCKNCYAIKEAYRLSRNPNEKVGSAYAGTVEKKWNGHHWTGQVNILRERLTLPLTIKKPKRIFVNSMSDLFHKDVPYSFIDEVFETILKAKWHTFQILTKRPENFITYLHSSVDRIVRLYQLKNCWFGVSIEDQKTADERLPLLLNVPARNLFVSAEPLLEQIDIVRWLKAKSLVYNELGQYIYTTRISWLIVGAEQEPWYPRTLDENWVRSLRDQCFENNVKFFYKQQFDGKKKISLPLLDGRQWAEVPEMEVVG
jgi:protein gp37